jgi:hypothetical protein
MGGCNEQASHRDARRVAAVVSKRHVQSTAKSWNDPSPDTTAENECDTNADPSCHGKNLVVIALTFRTADVYALTTPV